MALFLARKVVAPVAAIGSWGSVLALLGVIVGALGCSSGGGGGFADGSMNTKDAGTDAEVNGPDKDLDNDGFDFDDGDCNDDDANANPGAQDTPGNEVDEDCNGVIDDVVGSCDDSILDLADSDAVNGAKAMGLCKVATETSWGLLSAAYVKADGSAGMAAVSHGLLASFGDNIDALEGSRMLALSSGSARAPGDPGWERHGRDGYDETGGLVVNTTSASPAGFPVGFPGCGGGSDVTAYDPAALEITVRVPTNARSVRFHFNFYTAEFPEYVCAEYNDFFVALQSPAPDGAAQGNISFDTMENPISVNNGFLSVCKPQTAGGKAFTCPKGVSELDGTGFDEHEWSLFPDDPPETMASNGATGWLETVSPVEPGSEVTFRFAIWDAGDGYRDSLVLIDGFEFLAEDAEEPVTVIIL